MAEEIWRWTATRLAGEIAARQLSAREALEAVLARVDAVNPTVNAIVDRLDAEARAAADAVDAALARDEAVGPLAGVPVTTKINVAQAGTATTNGVVAFRNAIATDDAPVVANLRRAGAILFGRTNVPAFSWRWCTSNDLHGRTRNPHDETITPGGSSGGAAVAVATGMGPVAHGSDLAGSIRYPAFACGVYGLKPGFGRIPNFEVGGAERPLFSQLLVTQGPLARNVADLRLCFGAMAQYDPRDPWAVTATVTDIAPHRCRVALFKDPAGTDSSPAVIEALERTARQLAAAGYMVEETAPPEMAALEELFLAVLGEARGGLYQRIMQLGDDAIRANAEGMFAPAPELTLDRYMSALAQRSNLVRRWQLFLEDYPIILAPVSWKLPFPDDFDQQGAQAVAEMTAALQPTIAINLLGFPALALPAGRSGRHPVGVQIIAARFREEALFGAAAVIEAANGPIEPIDPQQ